MSERLKFELLAVDHKSDAPSNNELGLLHALRGLSIIWQSPSIDESNLQINDGDTSLAVTQVEPPTTGIDEPLFGRAYLIGLEGSFNKIESLREPLTAYLKERQQFGPLYVVRDEVSREIACNLYPLLYRIENLLRGYLIKFMTIQLGPGWWKQTAPREVDDKVKMRKKNEKIFGRHVDNFTYLTDFGELGAMVYEQSSGFLTRDDIVAKIKGLPETVDAIRDLKAELQTNYQKFFKESFADQGFKEKWKDFEYLRNKIAHDNLFTVEDLESGKQLFEELRTIIKEADRKTTTLEITRQERETLQETISENSGQLQPITESEFLNQLQSHQTEFERKGGFVGITHFIRNLLGRGFSTFHSHRMVESLNEQGKIEVYQVDNPYSEHMTSAIRISDAKPSDPATEHA